jgi:hypothetical protein
MKKYALLIAFLSTAAIADVMNENQVRFNDSTGNAFKTIVKVTGQEPVTDLNGDKTVTSDAKITCLRTNVGEHSCVLTIQ